MQQKTEKMLLEGGGISRSGPAMRRKGGFRCRLHSSRARVRVLCVLEKMKKACKCLLISLASAGKYTLKPFLTAKKSACASTPAAPARPSHGRSNSFYAEAISECIDFIKRSSSPMDSRNVD